MENITLGQIATWLAFIVALWGSVGFLAKKISDSSAKAINDALKPTNDKIDQLAKKVDSVEEKLGEQIVALDKRFTRDRILQMVEVAEKNGMNDIDQKEFFTLCDYYNNDLGDGDSYVATKINEVKRIIG